MSVILIILLPVKSWDGGENSIDSCVSGKHKRPRDDWDEELDRGKVGDVRDWWPLVSTSIVLLGTAY